MPDKSISAAVDAMVCGDCGWSGSTAKWRAECKGFPCELKAKEPLPHGDVVERAKIAFWASLTNANAGMRWLDHDSMEEMISAAWVGFEDALSEAIGTKSKPASEDVADILRRAAPAIEQLRDHQQQTDADGVIVGVSRQAIDEVLAAIAAIGTKSEPAWGGDFNPFTHKLTEAELDEVEAVMTGRPRDQVTETPKAEHVPQDELKAKLARKARDHDNSASTRLALSEALARIEQLEAALSPFAELADWIAENRPSHDGDMHEVQVHCWPYSISVGWLRKARALLSAERSGTDAAV